jgi:hypothetical protein
LRASHSIHPPRHSGTSPCWQHQLRILLTRLLPAVLYSSKLRYVCLSLYPGDTFILAPFPSTKVAHVPCQALLFCRQPSADIPVMEYSPSRLAQINRVDRSNLTNNKMSTLAMPLPHPHTGFHREFSWQEARPSGPSYRPVNEPDKIALPSIRQVA